MLNDKYPVLLIDGNVNVLDAHTLLLEQEGYHVSACSNPFDVQSQLQADWSGIVLSDARMSGCNGADLVALFHQDDNQLSVLLITGCGGILMMADAMKKGAWDSLQKPVDLGKLLVLVEDALRQRESVIARRHCCQQKLQVELVGYSGWADQYRQRLRQLAGTDIAVWSYGKPGTGRMTGTRHLHQLRRSAEGPFIREELTLENIG